MSTASDTGELALLAWLSPAYPVGAFAYSHGLEAAIEAGLASDASAIEAWIADLMEHGSIRNDAVLAAEAWRAGAIGDATMLTEINDLALALAASRERRLETGGMGRAFADVTRAAWPEALSAALPRTGDIAYPVAFGSACGAMNIPLAASVAAFGLAFAANLVSAAVRLGPIGQTDGQRIIAAVAPKARTLADWAAQTTLDDLGACAFRSDIAALHHETLYSRLFRS